MTCRTCHRPLTDPESVRRGVGPVCRHHRSPDQENLELEDSIRIPGDPRVEGVVLRRDEDGRAVMNVDHSIIAHSPTGMEWGYSGSGPADLALNILIAFEVPSFDATMLHQEFKREFLAGMPREGGTIAPERIREWIEGQKR